MQYFCYLNGFRIYVIYGYYLLFLQSSVTHRYPLMLYNVTNNDFYVSRPLKITH